VHERLQHHHIVRHIAKVATLYTQSKREFLNNNTKKKEEKKRQKPFTVDRSPLDCYRQLRTF
jgi:hypothetical protein